MHLLIALCLLAAPDGGTELAVYRSLEQVPEAWRRLIPRGFDFRTQQLASAAPREEFSVEFAVPQVDWSGAELTVTRPSRLLILCPPCLGIERPFHEESEARFFIYVLPRTKERVFEVPGPLLPPITECPVCPRVQ